MRRLTTSVAAAAALLCLIAASAAARSLADPPTVGNFVPKAGNIGAEVKIYGTNLQGARVEFRNQPAGLVRVNSDGTMIVATVGRETQSGPGTIVVTTSAGSVTAPGTFFVNPSPSTAAHRSNAPRIATVKPMRGVPGTIVTLTGRNFAGTTSVTLGGMKTTFQVPSDKKIRLTVPKLAHSGRIAIRTKWGTATSGRFVVASFQG